MTFDNANNDLLILDPSRSRRPPLYVFPTPSDPAKSTRFNCDRVTVASLIAAMLMRNTVCERDDVSLSFVSATLRASSPYSIISKIYAASLTFNSVNLLIRIPSMLSRTSRFWLAGVIRSLTHSL